MNAIKKVLLWVGMAAVVVVLMLWLMGVFTSKIQPGQESAQPGRPIGEATLVSVQAREMPQIETAVGSIRPVYESAVASKLLERVIEVNVRAGQKVAKDEVLVRLDDKVWQSRLEQLQASLASAQAAYAQANRDRESMQRAFEQKAVTQTELGRAETAVKSAMAELQRTTQALAEAQANLAYTVIRSPITGTVIDKKVNAGDTVAPGQVVVTLYDPTRMQLIASVRESLAYRLKVGQDIQAGIDAIGATCMGTVSEIVPESQAASRTFQVKVTGPCHPGIYAGMFGRLIIPVGTQRMLLVPRSTVTRIGQVDVVEVAQDGRLLRRAVQVGRAVDDQVQVLSGLKEGEQVAVPSQAREKANG